MKKTLKRLLTLTAVTAICSTSVFSVSALLGPEFDLENKEYQEYVTNAIEHYGEPHPRNDEICKLLSDSPAVEVKNLYGSINDSKLNLFEFGTDTSRTFRVGVVHWSGYKTYYKELTYTVEDLKTFISENNYKVDEVKYSSDYDDSLGYYQVKVLLNYSEDITADEVIDIANALKEKYGLRLRYETQTTEIKFTESVLPTIAGDLNLDDEQGITDIVTLTKYTASPELYPITDATALANADVNQDGVIDALDTNILIEMTLGSFESAV